MAKDIGPKIGIDGEREYRNQLANIIQQGKTLAAEMKSVTSAYDKNDNSQEKVTAQTKVLAQQIQTQYQRIGLLNQGLIEATAKYGAADTKTLQWKQTVSEATVQLNQMKAQLNQTGDAADNTGKSLQEAGNQSSIFGDVLKASLLSDAIAAGFRRIVDAAKEFSSQMIDTAAAVKAENAKFAQTFKEFGDEASASVQRVSKETGILPTRLNNAASSVYAFARASGGGATDAMTLMETALKAAADSAAYYDESVETATETLMSFLKGNYANDAALGVSATEATRNAKAMELFGQKYNDLSEIQKQQTLLKMVTDSQALSGAAGQAAREMSGWENVVGNLKESWRLFQANVGTPVLEALVPIVQEITTAFLSWKDSIDWQAFGEQVQSFINAIKENAPLIVTALAGIAAGFAAMNVAAMIAGVAAAFQSFSAELQIGTGVWKALTTAMNANPFVLIASLIAGLVAALITLWNTNEDFRNFWISAWDALKTSLSGVVDSVVNFFTVTIPNAFRAVIDFVKQNWQALLLMIVNPFAGAFKLLYDNFEGFRNTVNTLVERVKQAFSNLRDGIANTVGGIRDAIINGISAAVDWIRALPGQAWQWGIDMIQGFIDGIRAMISNIISAARNVAETIASYLHFSVPDKGPLSDADEYGPDFMRLMADGIRENVYLAANAARNAAAAMTISPQISPSSPVATSQPAPQINYGGITLHVNAPNVQNINELADVLMEKIATATCRKDAVYGR